MKLIDGNVESAPKLRQYSDSASYLCVDDWMTGGYCINPSIQSNPRHKRHQLSGIFRTCTRQARLVSQHGVLPIHPPFTGSAVVTLLRQRVGSIRVRATSTTSMSFSRLLKKYSQPSFSHSAPTAARGDHSSDDSNKPSQRRQASEPTPTIPRP